MNDEIINDQEMPADQANEQSQGAYDLPPITAMLTMMVQEMDFRAQIALGFMPPPGKEVSVNLDDAKVAIDTIDALAKVVKPILESDSDRREYDRNLADLRLNFVQKSLSQK